MNVHADPLSVTLARIVAERTQPAGPSAIARAMAEWPRIQREAARKARRREMRSFVEQYDRAFSLPRALLSRWVSRDDVRLICSMEHEEIVAALLRAIRFQRELQKHRYAPASGELIALRRVYVAERYYALCARTAARQRILDEAAV